MDEVQKTVFEIPKYRLLERMANHIYERATGDALLASKMDEEGPFTKPTIAQYFSGSPGLFKAEIEPLLDALSMEFKGKAVDAGAIAQRIRAELSL